MRIPDLSDIPSLEPVPAGEYDLRVTTAKDVTSAKGRPGIMLICEIMGEENAQNVFHRMWMPQDSDDDSTKKTMWRMIKEFMEAVGLDVGGSETEDFKGLQFSAQLSLTKDNKGRDVNEIVRVT